MSNREPTTELLRQRDVLAWLPKLNNKMLHAIEAQAEEEGIPISVRPAGPTGGRYYLKTPLKARLRLP